MPDASENPAPQRVPPEPLRRIDWLAVAPWLLLFRAPQACLGWPLVVGAIGAVVVGWPGIDRFSATSLERMLDQSRQVLSVVPGPGEVTAQYLIQCVAWPLIAVLISPAAAAGLTESRGGRFWKAIRLAPKRCLRVFTAVLLLASPAALFAFASRLYLLGYGWTPTEAITGAATPIAFWLLIVPMAILTLVVVVGYPLTVAAVCLDDADGFDAASRTFAYVTQRLGRLAFYVVIAWVIGVAAGCLVEAVIAFPAVFDPIVGPTTSFGQRAAYWGQTVAVRSLRGFYPAYFFTAATAIYLLLRHDIDGQPLDEMAGAPDQPAA